MRYVFTIVFIQNKIPVKKFKLEHRNMSACFCLALAKFSDTIMELNYHKQ